MAEVGSRNAEGGILEAGSRNSECGRGKKEGRVVRRSEGGEIGGSDRQLESFMASKMVVDIKIELHYILYYGGKK